MTFASRRFGFRPNLTPLFAILLALLVAVGAAGCGQGDTPKPPKPGVAGAPPRVLLVSIDGLRPVHYLGTDGRFATPRLRELADAGSRADRCESVFPTVTYPAHASIVTGVRTARHGIFSNTVFLDGARHKHDYRPGDWYWYADEFRVPTLWDAVRAKGLKSGAVSWPVTVGASIDYLIPEVWPARRSLTHEALLTKLATPDVLSEVRSAAGFPKDGLGEPGMDRWIAKAACEILRRRGPDLLLVHLLQVDHVAHQSGPDSTETRDAVRRADDALGEILDAVERTGGFERTTVLVCGDHGFMAVKTSLAPNSLFKKAGLVKSETDWKVLAHASGSQAAVYLRDPADRATAEKALALLLAHAIDIGTGKRLYNLVTRAELDRLGAYPNALCAIEAEPGYAVSGVLRDSFQRGATMKGNHGAAPSRPEMATGLVLAGRGIRRGARLVDARLIDIAPTVARLLGLDLPGAEGRVLEEVLEKR